MTWCLFVSCVVNWFGFAELRYGARYSDGSTLQVGVKCLVKLQPDQSVPYHCHIQEMRPDGGPCLVFIEELGEKRVVNYDQLEPLPQEEIRPWAPPYRYSRANSQFLTLSQMLQQIGVISFHVYIYICARVRRSFVRHWDQIKWSHWSWVTILLCCPRERCFCIAPPYLSSSRYNKTSLNFLFLFTVIMLLAPAHP